MNTRRLFVGVPFDEDTKTKLEQVQEVWRLHFPESNWRWIPSDNFHLTLHFLGNTPDWKIGIITDSLKRFSAQCTEVSLNRFLAFPSQDYAKVLAFGGAEGNSPLSNIFFQLGTVLQQVGHDMETRVFIPHVTLARTSRGAKVSVPFGSDPFQVPIRRIALFDSVTVSKGVRYDPLFVFDLK